MLYVCALCLFSCMKSQPAFFNSFMLLIVSGIFTICLYLTNCNIMKRLFFFSMGAQCLYLRQNILGINLDVFFAKATIIITNPFIYFRTP